MCNRNCLEAGCSKHGAIVAVPAPPGFFDVLQHIYNWQVATLMLLYPLVNWLILSSFCIANSFLSYSTNTEGATSDTNYIDFGCRPHTAGHQ